MMYKIYDSYFGEKSFKDWWSMIGYIIDKNLVNYIGHTKNEFHVYVVYEWNWKVNNSIETGKRYDRNVMVYNEDETIVNLFEIRKGIESYISKPKKIKYWQRYYQPYTYRSDPVPGIGHYGRHGYYRKVRKNKNYILNVMSYIDNDPRIKAMYWRISEWSDDSRHTRMERKSWKTYRKTQYKE